MIIEQVVSYLGAWQRINRKNSIELNEILQAADNYYYDRVKINKGEDTFRRDFWEKALFDLGWKINEHTYYSPLGRRILLSSLGPVKNGLSAQTSLANPSWFHRWLFGQGTLAVRYGMVKIPIIVAPMRQFEKTNTGVNRTGTNFGSFEYLKDQLETIAPLSSNFPFLIIGVNVNQGFFEPEITELASDPNITTEKIVVDRCIEFPPEYHQAGLGILNYFGVFLRENYPDREAKVKIEQHGLSVRLIVETDDGNTEVVEKALRDYQLVMSGKAKPEDISTTERAVLELKNELRITQFRLESQQDIIGIQNQRIDKLLDIIGNSMENSQNRTVAIQVSPIFHNSNSTIINQDISNAISDIQELLDSLPASDQSKTILSDLTGSLEAIETENDPEKLANSPGVTKLGRFLRRLSSGNEAFSKSIESIEKGKEIVLSLAKNYNKIAAFCGLPNIPFV